MLSWLNKLHLFLLCAILYISCGFIDFRPIGLKIEPNESGSLLPRPNSPVILRFDTKMEKYETEGILQIYNDNGMVSGDRFWKGNELYFLPVPEWTAGVRYTLNLSGTIRSADGREIRIQRFISFYAINKSEAPLLEWYTPADGESVGTGNVTMEFHFSRPMEKLSVESALTIDGIGNKTFEWSADDKILKVTPEKSLSPWTAYKWTLKEIAKSRDGVPLPKFVSAQFKTDLDQLLPQVKKVFPALFSNGLWLPTGADIESGLGPGQGIVVEFNKEMNESILRALRIEPSITGRTEFISAKSIVFIPGRDPEPEIIYAFIISGDAKDREGFKLGADFRICFAPDIPFLKILSFAVDGVTVISNLPPSGIIKVPVDPAAGEVSFTIRFSLPFNTEEKKNTALKIILSPFFPKTLLPVALNNVTWISDDRLRMKWEGLMAGNSGEEHYYKFSIPGGKAGINNGNGMFLKEDQYIYLEAVN
jgi:hypothetical protein